MNGVKLASLHTLQDGLAADAEGERGFEHCDVARRGFVDKTRAQVIGDADSPGCPRGKLLAGDEAVVEPAMDRGRCDAEKFGGAIDGDDITARLLLGRFEAGNFASACADCRRDWQ